MPAADARIVGGRTPSTTGPSPARLLLSSGRHWSRPRCCRGRSRRERSRRSSAGCGGPPRWPSRPRSWPRTRRPRSWRAWRPTCACVSCPAMDRSLWMGLRTIPHGRSSRPR
eukprot:10924153-Lingulodinium_polyedra.AAC.1